MASTAENTGWHIASATLQPSLYSAAHLRPIYARREGTGNVRHRRWVLEHLTADSVNGTAERKGGADGGFVEDKAIEPWLR
jgi:hypothetical protein